MVQAAASSDKSAARAKVRFPRHEGMKAELKRRVADLRYEIEKVRKAHDDLRSVFEARLRGLGVPEEELDLVQPLGAESRVPAGLVS